MSETETGRTDEFDTSEPSTRERILRAAAEVFAAKGYHGAGMTELGVAAKIQRGALYYHIGSKEELLFDLCKRHVEEALRRGREAIATTDDPIGQFRALATEHLRTLAERRSDVIVAEREMHALTGERAVRLAALRREHQSLFELVIKRGHEAGVFARSGQIDILGVLGMFNYTYVWLDPAGALSVDEIADQLVDLIIHGLGG
jgi:AcrR family transcriptional regulator